MWKSKNTRTYNSSPPYRLPEAYYYCPDLGTNPTPYYENFTTGTNKVLIKGFSSWSESTQLNSLKVNIRPHQIWIAYLNEDKRRITDAVYINQVFNAYGNDSISITRYKYIWNTPHPKLGIDSALTSITLSKLLESYTMIHEGDPLPPLDLIVCGLCSDDFRCPSEDPDYLCSKCRKEYPDV